MYIKNHFESFCSFIFILKNTVPIVWHTYLRGRALDFGSEGRGFETFQSGDFLYTYFYFNSLKCLYIVVCFIKNKKKKFQSAITDNLMGAVPNLKIPTDHKAF